jgi:outer membrane protein
MKNGLLILNVILLIAVGVLFYLHFSSRPEAVKPPQAANNNVLPGATSGSRIAYIEMDSLENNFAMIRDVKSELSRKEESMNNELTGLEKRYRARASELQGQAPTMNQVQSEEATKEMMQMQQSMQSRKQELDQQYQNLYMDKMKDVKTRIESFLKDYNKDKGYTYILAYEPGLFYYRDSTFNITREVINGLNKLYKK